MDRRLRAFGCATLLIAASAAPAAAVKRRAFTTSVVGTGDLSSWPDANGLTGVAAGDAICRARAAAAGLPNASAYRAWLSTLDTDAYCHVRGLTGEKIAGCAGGPPQPAGPWYLANGVSSYTGSLDELTAVPYVIYRPVTLDEYSQEIDDGLPTWTGTGYNGIGGSYSCSNWTHAGTGVMGTSGYSFASALYWSSGSTRNCSNLQHLLCLEPGTSEVTTLRWSPGAIAFKTYPNGPGDLSSWPQAGGETGLAAGDAICRNLAAAAHLPAPESFVAWLSTAGASAAERLTLEGQPFRRLDGFAVANSKADLLDGPPNSLHVHENGHYEDDAVGVWTGTQGDGTPAADDCDGWTDGTAGSEGHIGYAGFARNEGWTDWSSQACSSLRGLYCFSNVVTLFWDGFESVDTSRWSSTVP